MTLPFVRDSSDAIFSTSFGVVFITLILFTLVLNDLVPRPALAFISSAFFYSW
jgi:hypothetical protein